MIMCTTMVSRILALFVWAFVAASVAYWGLRWFAKPVAVPPGTSSVAMTSTPRGDFTKLLTGPAVVSNEPDPTAQSSLAARLQLLGIMAPRQQGAGGVALIVVDGKPSQAFRSGQAIDGELAVQSIGPQGVQIGHKGDAALLTLTLPLLPAAATGTLPSPAGAPVAQVQNQTQPAIPVTPTRIRGMPAAVGMAAQPVEGASPQAAPAMNQENQVRRLPPRGRRSGMVGGPPGGQNGDGIEQQQQPQ